MTTLNAAHLFRWSCINFDVISEHTDACIYSHLAYSTTKKQGRIKGFCKNINCDGIPEVVTNASICQLIMFRNNNLVE
jgi:hypothetical protein